MTITMTNLVGKHGSIILTTLPVTNALGCDELSTTGQADGLCYCLYNITVDKVIRQNETLGRS